MPRYKLTIEYDGGPFVGWQRQANGPSVQQALEEAIAAFCGATAATTAAGRTDAGVHALGQVAHVDLVKAYPADKVRDAVNYHLKPAPVAVVEAAEVDEDFNARFSAVRRHYVYRIVNRRAPLTVKRGKVWRVAGALDADAMHVAAQRLVGQHDFTTFRATECQAKSPVKTLERIDVSRRGEAIEVSVSAPSFLHHQVRSFVGTLERAGAGRWTADDVADALAAKDRAACGPVAPPDGLYLLGVEY
ncbi:MAG: tRNA pseudouridine(38-40) synthase TruA [Pseudomonadota bacterium]